MINSSVDITQFAAEAKLLFRPQTGESAVSKCFDAMSLEISEKYQVDQVEKNKFVQHFFDNSLNTTDIEYIFKSIDADTNLCLTEYIKSLVEIADNSQLKSDQKRVFIDYVEQLIKSSPHQTEQQILDEADSKFPQLKNIEERSMHLNVAMLFLSFESKINELNNRILELLSIKVAKPIDVINLDSKLSQFIRRVEISEVCSRVESLFNEYMKKSLRGQNLKCLTILAGQRLISEKNIEIQKVSSGELFVGYLICSNTQHSQLIQHENISIEALETALIEITFALEALTNYQIYNAMPYLAKLWLTTIPAIVLNVDLYKSCVRPVAELNWWKYRVPYLIKQQILNDGIMSQLMIVRDESMCLQESIELTVYDKTKSRLDCVQYEVKVADATIGEELEYQ